MFVEGEILVRDEYLDRVLEILGHPPRRELEQARQNPIRRVIAGVTRLTALGRHSTTLEALAAIDEALGRGIATPNHVMTVCPGRGLPARPQNLRRCTTISSLIPRYARPAGAPGC